MRVNVPLTLEVGTPTVCIPDAEATVKSQRMRLFDVAVLGPLMIWGGAKAGGLGGAALALFGVTTMVYNARNYARVRAMASVPIVPSTPMMQPPAAPAAPAV